MTIQCTNPTCKTSIPVPEGTSYVVCPVCNTWHFPSDYDNAGGGSSGMGNMDYILPSIPSTPPEPAPVAPPPANDPYTPYPSQGALPSHEPVFHHMPITESVKKERLSFGELILPDGRQLQLKAGTNILGRKCGELSVEDPTVSRKHCVIEVMPRSSGGCDYILYDIGAIEATGSTNGVYLSGRSLRLQNNERIPVYHGTIITLGSVRLVLQCPS